MKKIGFIGQGWIGKNYADDFERRGYEVVRYSLEPSYASNKDLISLCDIVFIAVPTPTTKDGFDSSIVERVMSLVGVNKTAVIKSTIIPGTTEKIQNIFTDRFVVHSPEFLQEKTAAHDASNPTRNIVGVPIQNIEYQKRAEEVLSVLPSAPISFVCSAKEAELVKYFCNAFLFTKVVFANIMYDLTHSVGGDWEVVKKGVSADPRIGGSHLNPVDASGHTDVPGRGAGGHCFIKDFKAFMDLYEKIVDDKMGLSVLKSTESKNIDLLVKSKKDIDILKDIYELPL